MWRWLHTTIYGLIAVAIAVAALAQQKNTAPPKRAAPPVDWDQRVRDVFFPDASEALMGPRPDYTGGSTVEKASSDAASTVGSSGAAGDSLPGASAVGGFAWSKLISTDTLQDEIKSLQPLLATDVKTQQVFLGGAYKNARRSFSVLATAFAIVGEFDKEVRWKNQAAAARDLFARAGMNCKTATVQSFNEAKLRSEDLAALLRGETVSSPSSVEPKNQWAQVADRAPLMSRLELAQQERIAPWTANAADFKKNAAAIQHEVEIIAAIAQVLMQEGLDDAGDETYDGYAQSMQQAALQIREAVKNDNPAAARSAAGALHQSCNACHEDYRG